MTIYYRSEAIYIDDRFTPGYLGVDGDEITYASPEAPAGDYPIVDYGTNAIFPGGVNTHTHSFQSLRRGCADGKPLEEWLKAIYSSAQSYREEECYIGGAVSFAEMLRSGTTTVADFFYLNGRGNANVLAVMRAAEDIGIRLVMGRTFMDVEWGGEATRESVSEASARFTELSDQFTDHESISVCPAPHSIYGASRELIVSAYESAKSCGSKWYMHLADSKASAENIADEYQKRSVELIDEWGLLDEDFVGIHAMWLSDEEIDLLAQRGASISHNPASNMILGERIIDLPKLWDRGIRVGLGTDGAASNHALNLFRDARLASLAQKVRAQDPLAVSADQIIKLATSDGGKLLHLPVGQLREGYKADFVVLNTLDVSLQPTSALKSNIVHALSEHAVQDVYVGGEKVVQDGELVKLDYAKICNDLKELAIE